jgi:hypothetical protein
MTWLLKWFRLDYLLSEQKTTSWWNFSELLSLRVFHLTWLLLLYMDLRLLFPLHSWHCYVQTESNTTRWQLCARGNRREAGLWRERPGYPLNCVRFRQGIARGYRSENGLSVRMGYVAPIHLTPIYKRRVLLQRPGVFYCINVNEYSLA